MTPKEMLRMRRKSMSSNLPREAGMPGALPGESTAGPGEPWTPMASMHPGVDEAQSQESGDRPDADGAAKGNVGGSKEDGLGISSDSLAIMTGGPGPSSQLASSSS